MRGVVLWRHHGVVVTDENMYLRKCSFTRGGLLKIFRYDPPPHTHTISTFAWATLLSACVFFFFLELAAGESWWKKCSAFLCKRIDAEVIHVLK